MTATTNTTNAYDVYQWYLTHSGVPVIHADLAETLGVAPRRLYALVNKARQTARDNGEVITNSAWHQGLGARITIHFTRSTVDGNDIAPLTVHTLRLRSVATTLAAQSAFSARHTPDRSEARFAKSLHDAADNVASLLTNVSDMAKELSALRRKLAATQQR